MWQVTTRLAATLVACAALAAGAAGKGADPLEIGPGETALLVEAGGVTPLRITPVPGGVLAVHNFTSADCRVIRVQAEDAPLEVPRDYTSRNASLPNDARPFDLVLEADGDGEVWVIVARDVDAVDALRSRAMVLSRARFLQRRADELDAQGDAPAASRLLGWAATDLYGAFRITEAVDLFGRVAARARGSLLEAEMLIGRAEVRLRARHVAAAAADARAAIDLLTTFDGVEAERLAYLAHVVAAQAESDPRTAYGHAVEAIGALPVVGESLADSGVEALLLGAESLARLGKHEVAQDIRDRAWQIAEQIDPSTAREVYRRAFQRRVDRDADRDGARRALDRLADLRSSEADRIDELRLEARLLDDVDARGAVLAEALERAAGVLGAERTAVLEVEHARVLAAAGDAERAHDAIVAACAAVDASWHPESRYLCLREGAVLRSQLLSRRVRDTDSLAWTAERNATVAALEEARVLGVEIGLAAAVDELDYFLAYVEALTPESRDRASERARRALAAGRERGDRPLVAAASILLVDLEDDPQRRLDLAREATRAAREEGALRTELNARALTARLLVDAGDEDGYAEQRRIAEALARRDLSSVGAPDELSRRASAIAGIEAWAALEQDRVASRAGIDPDAVATGLVSADLWSLLGLGDDGRLDDVADVAERVPPDTLVLRYADGRDDLYAYVISRAGITHRVVGPRDELLDEAFAFRRGIAQRDALAGPTEVAEAGHALWRRLVADVVGDERVAQFERLVVVPTPSLAHVPFEAFVVDAAAAPPEGFGDVAFALRSHRIRYASSLAGALDAAPQRDLASVLVAADSIADGVAQVRGRTLSALPGSRDEALAIAEIVGEGAALRLGADVTRDAILAELDAYDVLHFAVHGLSNDDPRRAGLALADGVLSTEDVRGRRLAASLVVLSACDTSSGRLRLSQRVDSLANAFHAAGAADVVATLWPVQDVSTAALMQRFYDGLVERGASAPDALTDARRAVLSTTLEELTSSVRVDAERGQPLRRRARRDVPDGHPYLWAPFVYVGRGVGAER